jgi:hypothetical protein
MRALHLITILCFSLPALAEDQAAAAEYRRISAEMERLGKRNAWTGVDKRFREVELLDAEISMEHYLLGAQAAQELGNMLEVNHRLRSAAEIKRSRQVTEWLAEVEQNYGRVTLRATTKGSAELKPVEMPIDPVQRNSINVASKRLANERVFDGLLPQGEYTFIDHSFSVDPGISVNLEMSPRLRRSGLIKTKVIYEDSDY